MALMARVRTGGAEGKDRKDAQFSLFRWVDVHRRAIWEGGRLVHCWQKWRTVPIYEEVVLWSSPDPSCSL